MSLSQKAATHSPARHYRISVSGTLEPCWSEYLGGMTLTAGIDGEGCPVTYLSGTLPDQAALRGILSRTWDLNLTVLSVHCNDSYNGGK